MPSDTGSSRSGGHFTTIDVGRRARVIVLRGVIRDAAVDELRERLLAAIEAGIREVVLDFSEVESLGSPVHDLVSAASVTIADRGGVLLVWSRKYAAGEPAYVITEIHDRALADLMATGQSTSRARSPS